MTDQLQEMGERIKALREIEELTQETMAEKCEVKLADYISYEKGEKDFSFSFLYNAANALGVDVVDLMSGDSPKLSTCCMVKKGGGFDVHRRANYEYKHLAFTFRHKMAEPFMVTVEPKNNTVPVLHAHEGQEFNYVLSGRLVLVFADRQIELDAGDCVYFNPSLPHGQRCAGDESVYFITVVTE